MDKEKEIISGLRQFGLYLEQKIDNYEKDSRDPKNYSAKTLELKSKADAVAEVQSMFGEFFSRFTSRKGE